MDVGRTSCILPLRDFDEFLDVVDFFRLQGIEVRLALQLVKLRNVNSPSSRVLRARYVLIWTNAASFAVAENLRQMLCIIPGDCR